VLLTLLQDASKKVSDLYKQGRTQEGLGFNPALDLDIAKKRHDLRKEN